jgi:hypothetical protein
MAALCNQMGKTQSEPLAGRHGRGTACARHGMCELALIRTGLEPDENIKMDLQEVGCVWPGLSWLRIGTGGGHL